MITYAHFIEPSENKRLDNILKWSTLITDYSEYDNYIVMSLDDKVDIGYIMYRDNHIFKIEIRKEFRGKGYIKELMAYFEQFSKDFWVDRITLTPLNKKVENMYRKMGFVDDVDNSRELVKWI